MLLALASGDEHGLEDYLNQRSPFILVVDHREEDDEIVRLVGAALPQEDVRVEADYSGDRPVLTVWFNSERHLIALTESTWDRIITVRSMQTIIAPKYTIKLIRSSFLSDTWCYYIRTTSWWTRAEQENLSLIRATFEDVPSDARVDAPVELLWAEPFPPIYTSAETEANQLAAGRRLRDVPWRPESD